MSRKGPGKRRSRSTATLRPSASRRLPTSLQPRRVVRLAGEIRGGVRDTAFAALVARIEDSPIHADNRVEVFFRGAEAFRSMLEAVAAAREELLLESYILRADEVGREFADALIAARARGVTVRVLADGFGSWATGAGFWSELRRAGIDARLFRPIWGSPLKTVQFRDHRKILVADRQVAFTGGMNIGAEYGSATLPRGRVFRDTHARVEGTAAREMAAVFREGWLAAGGAGFEIDPISAEVVPGPGVIILDTRPGRGAKEFAAAMAAMVGAARERLWLTTAYFAPRQRALRILGGAARRGVDVRLLLPGKSDVKIMRHAGHGFVAGLLRRGVRVFEYQPAILHAKTAVADGYASVIGSSNLDLRSFELNAECNFAVLDERVGRTMERQFERDLEDSVEIQAGPWRRRPWPHRVLDSAARALAPLL